MDAADRRASATPMEDTLRLLNDQHFISELATRVGSHGASLAAHGPVMEREVRDDGDSPVEAGQDVCDLSMFPIAPSLENVIDAASEAQPVNNRISPTDDADTARALSRQQARDAQETLRFRRLEARVGTLEGSLRSLDTPAMQQLTNESKRAASLVLHLATDSKRPSSSQSSPNDAVPAGPIGADSVGDVFAIRDDLRRLKCRFEYLERIVPPDVQRALRFFEPLRDDFGGGSAGNCIEAERPLKSNDTSAASVKFALLNMQAKVAQDFEDIRSALADGKREMEHITKAVCALQHDSDRQASKTADLTSQEDELQGRVDKAFPQFVDAFAEIMQRLCINDADDADNSELPVLQGLLSEAGGQQGTPAAFVSHDSLRQTVETLQQDVQQWLKQLQEQILSALRDKADTSHVLSLAAKLESAGKQPLSRTLASLPDAASAKTNQGSCVRWPLQGGRCIACDTRIELPIDPTSKDPWNPKQVHLLTSNWPPSTEAAPWPRRRANTPPPPPSSTLPPSSWAVRPMRRDQSLPALPAGALT